MPDVFSSVEKRILIAFREFFGDNYCPSEEKNTDIHVQAQKMCYLMSRIDCDIVDDGFVWNTFGPFSVGLQKVLRQIDAKREKLSDFYSDFYKDHESSDMLDSDILEGIERLRNGLDLSSHKEEPRKWIELLASLAFIAHSELPTSDFDYINEELKERKSVFECDKDNTEAWDLLNKLGVAY